jgi:phytoene dehydrogenase-like protein
LEQAFVAQLFIQYVPYDVDPKLGTWADPDFKRRFVENTIFKVIDGYCRPFGGFTSNGFSSSVLAYDALSPLDLERQFALHKGNIFHGSLGLHQLAYSRPVPGWSGHRTPVTNLYLCGAGTHPGGGVMGACGRNCAKIVGWEA